MTTTNSLHVIYPYKFRGVWVFDDERVDLVREPFVAGADVLISKITKTSKIRHAGDGFALIFSLEPFPGYTHTIEWVKAEYSGNWYYCPEEKTHGWLCPALLKYFDTPPQKLYVQAEKVG